ncbi:hypothetical protein F2Q69_00060585 [Brassica cretica]|uniref:Uncharacterized protein n=1 Tax=Brassica cretica TaxID=69181 RepID=A0A8S9RJ34_BRACR|nr:hypothetical protein F2Q69_00060585 [Brassica cretica]
MEFLETFGCNWSPKKVLKVIIGRTPYRSDQSGATPSSRSDLPIKTTLPERQGRVARVLITRRCENESGATSRSDIARSLPKHGATTRSDERRSLAFSSLGNARTNPERPLAATQRGRSRSMERLLGATSGGRSRFHHSETRERTRSDLSQRHSEVAPEAWSDYSERRAEVARVFITRKRENESGATSRSDTASFCLPSLPSTHGFDPLDPYGEMIIKWDLLQSSPAHHTVLVKIENKQEYRHVEKPGWKLSWHWVNKTVIWDMRGAETTEQGNCSAFASSETLPHCCLRRPTIVDLLPGAPFNMQVSNCCRGGVLTSMSQDRINHVSCLLFHKVKEPAKLCATADSFPASLSIHPPPCSPEPIPRHIPYS